MTTTANLSTSTNYRGRFAPSPTGELHIGSLIAALASYLDAKKNHGAWFVRIEDIDPPREIAGASQSILRTLETIGFEWDGDVIYQSQRLNRYRDVMHELLRAKDAYFCQCSRKDLEHAPQRANLGVIYPGYCRTRHLAENNRHAVRVQVDDQIIEFKDAIQGAYRCELVNESGDYVIRRADGFFAYQLAVVVDDEAQAITHIVRGADLLDLTPRQIHLQQRLGYRMPQYAHIPIITNAKGEKLSKQTAAPSLHPSNSAKDVYFALAFLGQQPPRELENADPRELIEWGMLHWNIQNVPKICHIANTQSTHS